MTPEVTVNLDLVQWCSVSVIPENKPLLQKFYQLIEIKLDFRFTKILVLSPNFQGGAMPVLPSPLQTPMDGKQLYQKSLDCKMLVSSGVT